MGGKQKKEKRTPKTMCPGGGGGEVSGWQLFIMESKRPRKTRDGTRKRAKVDGVLRRGGKGKLV